MQISFAQTAYAKSMNPPKNLPEIVSMLWTLANVVSGFAAVQAIAFGYMTLQPGWALKIKVPGALWIVTLMILTGVVLECWAVWWCHSTSIKFLGEFPTEVKDVFAKVKWGRIACLILFGCVGLLAAWGPLVDEWLQNKARLKLEVEGKRSEKSIPSK
jgi:hypothetical protein